MFHELAQMPAPGRVERDPLSESSRWGTPWAATALSHTTIAASAVSPHATWEATA